MAGDPVLRRRTFLEGLAASAIVFAAPGAFQGKRI
jgi:hypothetical protein